MSNIFVIKKRINNFNNKIIKVSGDKSLSIRWVLLASLAKGKSKSSNLLISEDVRAALNAIQRLGIKTKLKKMFVKSTERVLMVIDIKITLLLMLKIQER